MRLHLQEEDLVLKQIVINLKLMKIKFDLFVFHSYQTEDLNM